MDTQDIQKQVAGLQQTEASARGQALTALAKAADQGVDLQAAVLPLARALSDPVPRNRQAAAYALVSVAEHGGDIAPALPQLTAALADESEGVCKEAVWAVYCLASDNKDIAPAAAQLAENTLSGSRTVKGNSAIGLCLHYLNAGDAEAAKQLLQRDEDVVQFGAAWAHAEYYLRAEARAALAGLIQSIRLGLVDASLRDGLAAGIDWARRRGRDVSLAFSIIDELLAATQDPVVQAPLYGLLMKLQRRD